MYERARNEDIEVVTSSDELLKRFMLMFRHNSTAAIALVKTTSSFSGGDSGNSTVCLASDVIHLKES